MNVHDEAKIVAAELKDEVIDLDKREVKLRAIYSGNLACKTPEGVGHPFEKGAIVRYTYDHYWSGKLKQYGVIEQVFVVGGYLNIVIVPIPL